MRWYWKITSIFVEWKLTKWTGEESFFYPRELPIVIARCAFLFPSPDKASFFMERAQIGEQTKVRSDEISLGAC